MTKDEARQSIIANAGSYLKRDNSKKGYICPICGSGSGKKGTGITTKDKIHYTCWAGCYTNSDIIDIIGLENGLTDYTDKFKKACEEFSIDYDSLENDYSIALASARADFKPEEPAQKQDKNERYTDNTHNKQYTDYTEFFKECTKHRSETDYLLKRGISEDIQKSFLIGYCPKWQSPTALKKGSNPPATPRIIIPTSRYSYIARDTRSDLTGREKDYSKMKEGALSLFNERSLENMLEPVFVVEGEIDALSVIEVGFKCMALGSVNNYKKLVNRCREQKPAKPLLIALDNDKDSENNGKRNVGKETAEKLLKELREINVECYIVDINGAFKDANEALVADRELFKQTVAKALDTITTLADAEKQAYLATSTRNYMKDFINGIAESVNTPYTPTGFKELDNQLDGGLYEGFYCVGAISSLGKTTFVLQIADQIAKAGRDVLIFSLEMARNELIAKSVSRTTAELAINKGLPIDLAKTTRGITVYKFYKGYSQQERDLIQDAVDDYTSFSHRVYIKEGIGNIGALQIREDVKKHISITGNTPVVIIDYLQILAPFDDKNRTDKQNVDLSVTELKRISRDYKLPLIGISSFNRDNYNSPVNMGAFKESGSIEYSTDVLIGLQLAGVGGKNFDVDKAKSENPRKIEAKLLKNRNGKTGATVNFEYYPQYNYYKEGGSGEVWRTLDSEKTPFD